VALRKAQAENDERTKKQSQAIENLRLEKIALKKRTLEINKSRENDQALQAAVMKSQKERLAAEMKVQQEDCTSIL